MATLIGAGISFMQNFQMSSGADSLPVEVYSVRQRLLSASVSLTMTGSATLTGALAFAPVPQPAAHVNMPLAPVLTHTATHSPNAMLHPIGHSLWTGSAGGQSQGGGVHSVLPTSVSKSVLQAAVSQAITSNDLNLTSSTPLFKAGGLGGFNSITLDVGGKQQVFSLNSKLTASELVAAQQVESGGKQEITINSKGVANRRLL